MISQRAANRLSWAVFVIVLSLWLLQTKTTHDSWNESSRLAAIESLVERATWRIDASPYGHQTGDKIQLNGHYYSTKPPLFSALAAAPYALLHYGLGANLAVNGCQPGTLCVYYWLTVLMVGLPSALLAALFFRLVWRQRRAVGLALALTALLCAGTMIWPYSLVFNNHVPAAAALFGSFYLLYDPPTGRSGLFWAGLLAGLAVMIDLTSIFLAASLFFIGCWDLLEVWLNQTWTQINMGKHRLDQKIKEKSVLIRVLKLSRPFSAAPPLSFVMGGLVPAALTFALNYQITGSLFLPYFFSEGYNYPGGEFAPTIGGQSAADNIVSYTFRSLVGDHGLLLYSPVLIFGLIGLIQAAAASPRPLRVKSVLILAGMAGHLVFIWLRTNNFGGDAYGLRYFIPAVPVLFFFTTFLAPAGFFKPLAGKIGLVGWAAAACLSIFSAYQGVINTWHQVKPPLFLAGSDSWPYLAVERNLALDAAAPTPAQTRPRVFEAPAMSRRLDVTMNHAVVLLGYDLPARRVNPGENLRLTLYWQLLTAVRGDYFVFTHLLDAHQNRQGGLERRLQEGYPIAFWYPGEVVTDQREIPVAAAAPDGLARLRLGGYELAAGQAKPLPLSWAGQDQPETSLALASIFIGKSPQVIEAHRLQAQQALSIPLGEPPVLALRGYDLARGENQLQLKLYWQSLGPTMVDWTTFVHLRDETGKIVAQQDGPTGGGQYPTSLWQPGEIVADTVTLPTAGLSHTKYDLVIGLYNLNDGARLTVPGSPVNEIKLDSITF